MKRVTLITCITLLALVACGAALRSVATSTPVPTALTLVLSPTTAVPMPGRNGPAAAPASPNLLVVNATDDVDDGSCDSRHCSLREAIVAANERKGPDEIVFDPAVFPPSGTVVIELVSILPTMFDDYTTIDASEAGVTVDGSQLIGETTHGFHIQSSDNTLKGICIQSVPGAGVAVASFDGNEARNNTLDSITVINSGHGGPPFTGRTDAIEIRAHGGASRTHHNRVINCTVENNADDGIEVVSDEGGVADSNFVVGNVIRGNAEVGVEIDAKAPGSASYNLVANNTIEGINVEFNAGIIVNSHGGGAADGNNIVGNSVAKGRDVGIAVLTWDPGSSASQNMVFNNTVIEGNGGIIVASNGGGAADGNTIVRNTVGKCGEWGIGVLTWDPGSSASQNMVINNMVEHTNECGIEVDATNGAVGRGNWVYHNNIIENNHCQAIDHGENTRWDHSGEGNYWSDYTGQDEDADGIGDTPYHISPSSVDNYPLMTPCTDEQRIYLPVVKKS